MEKLQQSVSNFTSLENYITDGSPQLFHKVISCMHDLCFHILRVEKKGSSRESIEEVIKPARDIHSRSVFVKRLQEWPREYPGDFETIEYICNLENKSQYGTVEYFIEEYALNTAIAQQHRNRMHHQAEAVLDLVLSSKNGPAILSVGCGGCRDISGIAKYIRDTGCKLVINDVDNEALELSTKRLGHLNNLSVVQGNIIQALRKVEHMGPFDLILAGGLFDHISDRHVSFFLKHASKNMLNPDGVLFFANAAEGNPFRVWIEYLANWKLVYRSYKDIMALLNASGFSGDSAEIKKDETGLSFLVKVKP